MPQFYARLLFFFLGLFTLSSAVDAQNIRISQGGRINTCTGVLFDSGGAGGDHAANGTTHQITICSDDGGALSHIRVDFTELNIDGELTVYGGDDTSAPVQTTINSGDSPGFNVTATQSNPTGCLTFVFTSTGTGAGWSASISCVRSCQSIDGIITTVPAQMPATNGYVDICPGDEIIFTAEGVYAENNLRYTQSDATSFFSWNFQDGTIEEGFGLTSISHIYDDPGGYLAQLTIRDADGCENSTRISQRVRVAPPPVFSSPDNLPSSLCVGEEVILTVGRDGSPNSIDYNPTPVEFSFNTSQSFTELTFLPDGNGSEYSSPLVFSNFNPGQTLGQASDLVRICATMEHSYLGDLDIWITCPDGSILDLHRYSTSDDVQRQLLGQGDQDTNTPDPPGRYCWTATAPRTMAQHVSQFNIGSDQTMPEIDYAAEESFNTLVGCPLNGEWALNIRDNLTNDNGYIYEWSIEFVNSLYPNQETFVVPVNDFRFEDFDNFSFYGTDSVIFAGQNPGPNSIRIVSTDDYGCVYDTSVTINILPPYDPACANCGPLVDREVLDTSICLGESFTPDVIGAMATDTFITFESFANAPFGNAFYPDDMTAFLNDIVITDFTPDRITNVAADLSSICVNLENTGDLDDVTIQIIAPNGRVLTLVENFGGNGEDLTQTCFSPTATTPLSSGTAPYTGTFAPIGGNWTAFNNSPINGTWQLLAFDRQGNDLGELIGWSLSLNYDRGFTYEWLPNDGNLSCTDCPNPTITPDGPATYTLNVMTAAGCTDMATVNVSISTLDISVTEVLTNPSCPGTMTGAIDVTVTGSAPSYNYIWNDGVITEDRTFVGAGTYTLTISNDQGCEETFSYMLTERPALVATLDEVIDASCFGASNGEIRVTTTGGTPPYTFSWDDPNAQVDEDAGALTTGTYNLLVTDALGCTTTLQAVVDQPDQLAITFRSSDVTCRDGDDGNAVALPTGGNGIYSYMWQTGSDQDSVFNLTAGTYEVTVTDSNGCTASNTVTIDQPATPLTATVVQDRQGCFEASANQATVTPSGGTPGYSYLWSNGETTATALALPSGLNTVMVTDDGGCVETFSVTLEDLPEITVNIIANLPSCNDRTDGRLGAIPMGGAGTVESDYTYQWSNGQSGVAISNLPGDLLYRVTVTGPRGCTGEGERFLNAPPPITFTADETPVTCFGESNGALTIANISGPNPGNYDLQWGPEAGNSTAAMVSGLPAGDNYTLRITDVDGCTIDTVLRITEPTELTTSINKFDVSCFGETDGRISALGNGGAGGYIYEWSTGSGQNQIVSLPAGSYELTVTDGNQCEDISTVEIVQPSAISISATSTAAICEGEATGTINITGGGGRQPYVYGLENQGFTRNSMFIGLQAGEYIAFVRDSSGCQTSSVVQVSDGPEFSLMLPADTTIIFGDSIDLIPTIVGGIDSLIYNWTGSYGGTLDCEDCPTPNAMPEYEIDYSLVVADANGCTAEDRFRVSVRKIREVAVPTGFSPNGDASNDVLIVHGRPGTQVVSFTVFDRWANVLYEASDFAVNDASMGWDGTVNMEPVNAGVYLYKIVVRYDDDSEEVLSGETTLIR
ncbi:proprotein convertase P-domain-containing protein [Neolewinella aurantiaca]|nr:proprotein convertase P-domain-containing protein [Neolewinella aurantiaca]